MSAGGAGRRTASYAGAQGTCLSAVAALRPAAVCHAHACMQERNRDSFVYDYYRAVEPSASDPPGAAGGDGMPVVQARSVPPHAPAARD